MSVVEPVVVPVTDYAIVNPPRETFVELNQRLARESAARIQAIQAERRN